MTRFARFLSVLASLIIVACLFPAAALASHDLTVSGQYPLTEQADQPSSEQTGSLPSKKSLAALYKTGKLTVSVAKSKTYTGKAIKPVPTVKLNGKKLKKGIDYTVSYTSAKGKKVTPKKVGTYKVVVTGKGAYKGKVSVAFKVKAQVAYKSTRAWDSPVTIGKKKFYTERIQTWSGRYTSRVVKEEAGIRTVIATDTGASILTNGRYLFYSSYVGETYDSYGEKLNKYALYRRDLKTGKETKIAVDAELAARACSGTYLYISITRAFPYDTDLYALNLKTKKKRFMTHNVGQVAYKSGRVITKGISGDASNTPLCTYSKNGTGKKTITKALSFALKGNKIYYTVVKYSSGSVSYRTYTCSLAGKSKKAITGWEAAYPSRFYQ